jgi:hypothetical protein
VHYSHPPRSWKIFRKYGVLYVQALPGALVRQPPSLHLCLSARLNERILINSCSGSGQELLALRFDNEGVGLLSPIRTLRSNNREVLRLSACRGELHGVGCRTTFCCVPETVVFSGATVVAESIGTEHSGGQFPKSVRRATVLRGHKASTRTACSLLPIYSARVGAPVPTCCYVVKLCNCCYRRLLLATAPEASALGLGRVYAGRELNNLETCRSERHVLN